MTSSPQTVLASIAQLGDQLDDAMTDLRAAAERVPSVDPARTNDVVGVRFPFDDAPGFPQITLSRDWAETIAPEEIGACVTTAVRDKGPGSTSIPAPPPLPQPDLPGNITDINDMLRRLNETATRNGRIVEQLARSLPDTDAPTVDELPGTVWSDDRQVAVTVLTGQVTAIHINPAWAADRGAATIATTVNEVIVTALEETSVADRSDPDRPFADPFAAVRILQEHL